MILQKHTICDPFTLITTGDQTEKMGIKTFRYTNRITGETTYAQIDVPGEILSQTVTPVRKAALINMLSNKGFLISPFPESLHTFLHILIYPGDAISLLGSIETVPLPSDAVVEIISSCETKEDTHEH